MDDKHIEHDKTIHFNGEQLHGTLCVPAAAKAQKLVLMLPGSGEIDRNENALAIQLNTFNALAHQLAEAGIASFRYDKRGVALSGGNYNETGFHEFVDDARQWLASLSSFNETSGANLYMLGHSEGTMTACFLSLDKTNVDGSDVKGPDVKGPDVKGQILLTPFVQNLEIVMGQQLQQTMKEIHELPGIKGVLTRLFVKLSGDQLKKQKKLLRQAKNTSKSSIKVKKTVINAKWLRELMAIDPKTVYTKITLATLSIGGEKDLQCRPEDALDIAQLAQGPVQAHVLENMTHILRVDEMPASIFRYKELTQEPIDDRIAELIVRWLAEH